MSDEISAEIKKRVSGAPADQSGPAPASYQPPSLTKVGNVRELLAGNGGTVTDADPTSLEGQQG